MELVNYSYTPTGHIIGMLDRDQRTAKIPTYTKNHQDQNSKYLFSAIYEHQQTQPQGRNPTNNRDCFYLRRSLQRLKQVLVVGTYLLIVIPNALSAPTSNMDNSVPGEQSLYDPVPKWILNPIQYTQSKENITNQSNMIHRQANTALQHANDSFEKYTQDQFNMSPSYYSKLNSTYEWLPPGNSVSNEFGQDVTDDPNFKIGDAMVSLFTQFQKVAVGLEQVIVDHKSRGANANQEHRDKFVEMLADLRVLLIELQIGIANLGLMQPEDVTRAIMPDHIRNIDDETTRRSRDWVIYRDYINLLEYTKKIFPETKNIPESL